MIEAAAVAVRILSDRCERRRVARSIRAVQHKVLLNLRVSGDTAEILDRAAANRGMTIDEFVERFAHEVAR